MDSIEDTVQVFQLFADPTRVRLLSLLAREELTVAELTAITGVAQSRVSTHLAKLRDGGLVRVRRDGARSLYRLREGAMPEQARRAWGVVEGTLSDGVLQTDRDRCDQVLQARVNGMNWLESVAGEMDRHYSPGRTWESLVHGFSSLVRLGKLLDIGCGDGAVAALLSPNAVTVTCLDRSERMLDAARKRLDGRGNVDFVFGDMHSLPFEAEVFDHVGLWNVLTYSEAPARALAEAARVLRPGGTTVILTLSHHEHLDIAARYGHVQPGFRPVWLRRTLTTCGLNVTRCEVVAREQKLPRFETVLAHAEKPPHTERRTRRTRN
jgi:ArsR family transcriptional regulator